MGASLLVFSNKTDVDGCMSEDDIRKVIHCLENGSRGREALTCLGITT